MRTELIIIAPFTLRGCLKVLQVVLLRLRTLLIFVVLTIIVRLFAINLDKKIASIAN
jgi:hypothetical protein